MNEEEQWRPINDYNNYSISSFGRVRNDDTGLILKPAITSRGYLRLGLYKNNIRKNYLIHRLIGIHFLPNWNNKECIDHVNRNSLDNRIINLRWATSSENSANKTKKQNTTSKYIGVSFDKNGNKWRANINCKKLTEKRRTIHLGSFKTEEEANSCRQKFITENNLEEFYNQKI